MLKHKVTEIEQYSPLFNYAHPKNLCNPVYLLTLQSQLLSAMLWSKNGKINIISKLQLQMKGNPIHILEWLIHLSNLIILENHKRNLNIDLGIQMRRLSSTTLEN